MLVISFCLALSAGLKIDPVLMDTIIDEARGDMRQVINNLFLLSRGQRDLTSQRDALKAEVRAVHKDFKSNAFECTPDFFRGGSSQWIKQS